MLRCEESSLTVLLIDIPVFPRDAAREPDAEVSSHISSRASLPAVGLLWESVGFEGQERV